MDLSIEAIEADLARAESTLGRPESAIHMQRAQVRATLRSAQAPELPTSPPFPPYVVQEGDLDVRIMDGKMGTTYVVPTAASFEDRMQAARHLIADPDGNVTAYLFTRDATQEDRVLQAASILGLEPDDLAARLDPTAGIAGPAELVEDDQRSQYADEDIDADFFAEARREHKKSGK